MRICPQCQTVFQEDGVYCPHDRAALLTLRADDARCGQLIDGRYLLLARIGRGGMGAVYRAWQSSMDREVALKLLAEPVAEAPVALERFLREARVTAGLRCPHTVRVFDFGQLADATPYLAMELVEGVTLDQRLRDQGALPPAQAIEIVRQISLALEEAHGQGLVHRDLKPSNVMVTRLADGEDFARVLDFGVAKIMDD
ncbi:MAG: serine/threonine protein kinase, partial [Myxococcales bacterium]|nr:serine/threonine protein kinase [Myxococcales bacterium]